MNHCLPLFFASALVFAACSSSDEGSGDGTADQGEDDRGTRDTGGSDAGGSDTGGSDTGGSDTGGEDTGGTDTDPGGLFGQEEQGVETEWADCISGCGHALDPEVQLVVDLRNFSLDGVQGTIDGEDHQFTRSGVNVNGPDLDLIGVLAEPRTMVEVIVSPRRNESAIDPVVTVHDGFMAVAYNSDQAEGDRAARVVFAHPYLGLPMWIAIEDAINYENFQPGGGSFVGGDGYEYTVTFTTSDFAPIELGTLADTPLTSTGATLAVNGDMHYYRFEAPFDSAPTVQITATGGTGFVPSVAGMNTIEGQVVWNAIEHDDPDSPTGSTGLVGSDFRVCDPPCSGNAEFIFAVSDWNGESGGGTFTYDVSVSAE